MAYNVSLLSDYTNEQNFPILRASILGSKTANLFSFQSGIKSSAELNIMDVDVVLQDDSVGASTAGGGEVKFSQRRLAVAPICVREFFDPKTLNSKYIQSQLKAGSEDNELAFEKEIMDEVTGKVAAKMEVALWKGDTTLIGNTDLKHFDGYLKLIDAAGDVVLITGSTITDANVIATVDNVYAQIPVEVLDKDDMGVYMGRDLFRTYTMALKAANLFHYNAGDGTDEITIPGTAIKIYALNGLNGTGRIVAGRKSNFFIGTDLMDEEDKATALYLPESERVKLKIAFKYGAQIAFPSEIVTYKA